MFSACKTEAEELKHSAPHLTGFHLLEHFQKFWQFSICTRTLPIPDPSRLFNIKAATYIDFFLEIATSSKHFRNTLSYCSLWESDFLQVETTAGLISIKTTLHTFNRSFTLLQHLPEELYRMLLRQSLCEPVYK